jgi:uncharacterized protein (TIGR02391 family)
VWLIAVFPNLATLEAAAIEDIAYLALGEARLHERKFSPANIIDGISVSPYMPPSAHPGPSEAELKLMKPIVAEAFGWLESEGLIIKDYTEHTGDWYLVSRRGRAIKEAADLSSYAKRAYLPRDVLREDVAEVALSPFLAGRYDEAVRAAFTRLEVSIREAAGYGHEQYGVAMVRDAFGAGNKGGSSLGPLADPDMEFTEREAVAHLLAGAIGYIKNPLSHRELNIDDARLAASRILLANDLMYTLAGHVEKKRIRETLKVED